MKESRKDDWSRLYEIAVKQHGYFTPHQAIWAGIDRTLHGYHLKVRNWTRASRGIYHLPLLPPTRFGSHKHWELWSADRAGKPQGVFSHQTALLLLGAAIDPPSKIHMNVPRGFRHSGPIPQQLRLYYVDLPKSNIVEHEGFRCTSPLRTILDVAAHDRIQRSILRDALLRFLDRGQITPKEIQHTRIPPAARAMFKKLQEHRDSRS